jgi:hypothetical protein
MLKQRLLAFLAIAGLIGLASCGGGGGGGGDAPPPAPVCGTGAASVTISGVAQFENVPISASNGALNYNAITPRPIRGAVVEILCGTTVLASTETSASGAYSAAIPPTSAIVVRVKAQMVRTGAPAWNFRVLDNTNSSALYVLDSASTSGNASSTVNLLAGSGWNGSSYATVRASGPFAILDTVYASLQTTLGAAPNQVWPALDVYWSVNNRSGSGCAFTSGCIGTTSFGSVGGVASMFVLGLANADTDEFDSHVIAHEFGHYLQSAVSRDDSIGGSHGAADRLDMRVAFSEGWGNGWSGIVLNDPIYRDSSGPSQSQGFTLNVSVPPSGMLGWYREMSVANIVWNLNQQIGFTPLWNALTGPVRTTDGVATSAHLLAAALKEVAPGEASTVTTLFNDHSINTTDAIGTGETNDGGVATALPLYKPYGSLGSDLNTLCVTDAQGNGNKLGNYSFARVTVAAGTYTVRLSGGQDPDFVIFNSTFSATGFSADPGVEQQVVNLPAGSYVVAVEDFNLTQGLTSADVCLTLRITP